MKNTVSKIIIVGVILAGIFIISASAMGHQNVFTKHSLLRNSISACFSESVAATGAYSTEKGKIVKQCYVRMQEGNYDSGRKYSAVGQKTGGTRIISTVELSKANNIFNTCYTNYGWLYY